jgi:hypothetical protein
VVINEFEIVPTPAVAAGEKGASAAPPPRQEPDPNDVAVQVRIAWQRVQRLRAH